MPELRVYLDTSVIGGCFDREFAKDSLRIIEAVKDGRLIALVSDIVIKEVNAAPDRIVNALRSLTQVEHVDFTDEALSLREAYLAAKILDRKWEDDATHVALATVARTDAILSWNFKHVVRLDKIKAFNQVNELRGFEPLTILSPKEALWDDD